MLEFRDVTFKYDEDDIPMMTDLSFTVDDGEFISIIGASGCGKSTLFRLINGLEKPQSGEIFVNGKSIEKQKNYSSFMPQKDLLLPWKTIEQNVCLPMEIMGVPKEKQKKEQIFLKSQELVKNGLIGLWSRLRMFHLKKCN